MSVTFGRNDDTNWQVVLQLLCNKFDNNVRKCFNAQALRNSPTQEKSDLQGWSSLPLPLDGRTQLIKMSILHRPVWFYLSLEEQNTVNLQDFVTEGTEMCSHICWIQVRVNIFFPPSKLGASVWMWKQVSLTSQGHTSSLYNLTTLDKCAGTQKITLGSGTGEDIFTFLMGWCFRSSQLIPHPRVHD